jgi:hypothetical protein
VNAPGVEGSDCLAPVDIGVGFTAGAGAGDGASADECGLAEPGAVGSEQFDGSAGGVKALRVVDQLLGEVGAGRHGVSLQWRAWRRGHPHLEAGGGWRALCSAGSGGAAGPSGVQVADGRGAVRAQPFDFLVLGGQPRQRELLGLPQASADCLGGVQALLFADVVNGRLVAVPRGIMAAGNVMQGSRGGVDLPKSDIERVKSHLAKYYKKMGDEAPWLRD